MLGSHVGAVLIALGTPPVGCQAFSPRRHRARMSVAPSRPRTAAPSRGGPSGGRPSWNTRFALDAAIDTAATASPGSHSGFPAELQNGRLHAYNSLMDPSLRTFFAKPQNRRHLLHAAFVSDSGVIVSNPEEKMKIVGEQIFRTNEGNFRTQRCHALHV